MQLAILSPFSPVAKQSSGAARLEMFEHLPTDWKTTRYVFGDPGPEDISIGTYFPLGSPKNLKAFFALRKAFAKNQRENPAQALWVTLPPIMMALFAVTLKKKYCLPLVIDVRDPGISSVALVSSATSPTYKLAFKLEKWAYHNADAICVTTPTLAEFLSETFDIPRGRFVVVSNASNFKEVTLRTLSDKPMNIVYAGTFAPYQVLKPFLTAFIKTQTSAAINLYGSNPERDAELMELCIHDNRITFHPPVSRDEVFQAIRESDVVLVPIDGLDHPELYEYAVPLKYYEALALSRPILLYGGTAASIDELKTDKAGVHIPLDGNLEEALTTLRNDYQQFATAAKDATHLRSIEVKKLIEKLHTLTS